MCVCLNCFIKLRIKQILKNATGVNIKYDIIDNKIGYILK